ncbi:PAS domain-containing protein [Ferrovibrio sp.]|uniref:PAS domain-containing protein n=1 Tax=Ferrovibrio sp. TaxID=1917215 RepID=UPI003D1043B8
MSTPPPFSPLVSPLAQPGFDLGLCGEPEDLKPHLLNPPLARLLDDWNVSRTAGRLPGRAEFPPERLRYLLGNIFMLDVETGADGGTEFRYRVFGSNFSFARGFDLTGKQLSEHPDPHAAARAYPAFGEILRRRQPLLGRWSATGQHGETLLAEMMVLPLSDDGVTVNRLLAGQFNQTLDLDIERQRAGLELVYAEPELLGLRVRHPGLQHLLTDWRIWRGARRYPGRADVQPERLRYLLGNLFLLDVVPQQDALPRFRYRLFGSNVARFRGYDLSNRFLDEHPDSSLGETARRAYAMVALHGRPLWVDLIDAHASLGSRFEGLILPLASDGETIDMLLAAQVMR